MFQLHCIKKDYQIQQVEIQICEFSEIPWQPLKSKSYQFRSNSICFDWHVVFENVKSEDPDASDTVYMNITVNPLTKQQTRCIFNFETTIMDRNGREVFDENNIFHGILAFNGKQHIFKAPLILKNKLLCQKGYLFSDTLYLKCLFKVLDEEYAN